MCHILKVLNTCGLSHINIKVRPHSVWWPDPASLHGLWWFCFWPTTTTTLGITFRLLCQFRYKYIPLTKCEFSLYSHCKQQLFLSHSPAVLFFNGPTPQHSHTHTHGNTPHTHHTPNRKEHIKLLWWLFGYINKTPSQAFLPVVLIVCLAFHNIVITTFSNKKSTFFKYYLTCFRFSFSFVFSITSQDQDTLLWV